MNETNDAIDRALEQIGYMNAINEPDAVRAILTDLAAEIRAAEERKHRYWRDTADEATKENDILCARLAAVVEYLEGLQDDIAPMSDTEIELLAIARGEGCEQAGLTEDDAASLQERSTDGERAEILRKYSPAAPDAPQITMHAYNHDEFRGCCLECGREPEHPCHGEGRDAP